MSKTESFIRKSRLKHGEIYDYSKSVYTNAHAKITITCPIHGDFTQAAYSHVAGHGCAKCAKKHNYTTEEFIQAARLVHGDKFDYSKVNYKNGGDKQAIICRKHGEFYQAGSLHLSGQGCAKCYGVGAHNTETWVSLAKSIHGERYRYENVEYTKSKALVSITCREHGEFYVSALYHVSRGPGCPGCASDAISRRSKMPLDSFIAKAIEVHGGKYKYDDSSYTKQGAHVRILCGKHGWFMQSAKDHLSGCGCPACPKRYGQESHVYILQAGDLVKIGIAIDAGRRAKELKRLTPFEFILAETFRVDNFPKARAIEVSAHAELQQLNAGLTGFDGSSEWFTASPDQARSVILSLAR